MRQRLPSLNARIRMKRTQLGLTGAELAQRADISPSYVSLIEKGAKVPDEGVAARLARSLQDDEDLYRAWARAARLGLHRINQLSRIEAISRSPAYLSLVERGAPLPDELGAEARVEAMPARERAAIAPRASDFALDTEGVPAPHRSAPEAISGPYPEQDLSMGGPQPPPNELVGEPEVLSVPVLAPGADPGKVQPSPLAVSGRLLVDRRLVADHSPERLFAYEVTFREMKHLRGVASPGDRIVFQRGGRVGADRVCAVRTPDGIVLARVLFKGRSLLLLPGEGERDFESVDVEGLKALPGVIAGTHVLLIRR
jgi:transcriptional regulator with XRE-family HTH domain